MKTARAGKPWLRCYRLLRVRPCVSCRHMWVFPLAAAVVAFAFAAALARRSAAPGGSTSRCGARRS